MREDAIVEERQASSCHAGKIGGAEKSAESRTLQSSDTQVLLAFCRWHQGALLIMAAVCHSVHDRAGAVPIACTTGDV